MVVVVVGGGARQNIAMPHAKTYHEMSKMKNFLPKAVRFCGDWAIFHLTVVSQINQQNLTPAALGKACKQRRCDTVTLRHHSPRLVEYLTPVTQAANNRTAIIAHLKMII